MIDPLAERWPIVRRIRVYWTADGPVIDPGYETRRKDDPFTGQRQPGAFAWTARNIEEMLHGRAPVGSDGARVMLSHRAHVPHGPLDEWTATVYQQWARSDPTPVERRIDPERFAAHYARYWVTRVLEYLHSLPGSGA